MAAFLGHLFNVLGFAALVSLHHTMRTRYPDHQLPQFFVEITCAVVAMLIQVMLPKGNRFANWLWQFILVLRWWPLMLPPILLSPVNKFLLTLACHYTNGWPRWWMYPLILRFSFPLHVFFAPVTEE
ncbi:unnamed protein product [Zymoseptoria tritici ST99CH_3D1]|uniref:Uncharacterized protein n=2 Tax=Zymoseptoria tritici TaxID=1047171 RepID=F9XS63_ZYMTI|nr:uncharacterized protein MYCGRDRAFT_98052 [Zymoseptoria tritici IPO323]EGP81932.1 hypothetical protein MYCGRDRAFT_98052 [Zymoseptoria tritici IPO323]SMQ56559.1 unnamed protein product [Zymoseptoria tritici ST99CH_3D7]SMR65146.1 unnamed protein product [Zymoseptoria tritici ST99CH_3D1]